MSESSLDKLTALQRDVLVAFFAQEQEFYLTGGAALAGFYLHHRETTDLDLFTLHREAFDRGARALATVAHGLGATLAVRQHVPDFARYVLTSGDASVVVDLVLDETPQAYGEKVDMDGIRVDPVEEILANKLTTLLSRAEERDLVDVMLLERAGHRVESALSAALAKDGGCTPATLAWVLSDIEIPDGIALPASVLPSELRAFLAELIKRLLRASAPVPALGGSTGSPREEDG
jgi:hypothetical protein